MVVLLLLPLMKIVALGLEVKPFGKMRLVQVPWLLPIARLAFVGNALQRFTRGHHVHIAVTPL